MLQTGTGRWTFDPTLSRVSLPWFAPKIHALWLVTWTLERARIRSWYGHSIVCLLAWCCRDVLLDLGGGIKTILRHSRSGRVNLDWGRLQIEWLRLGERLVLRSKLSRFVVIFAILCSIDRIIMEMRRKSGSHRSLLEARGVGRRLTSELSEIKIRASFVTQIH